MSFFAFGLHYATVLSRRDPHSLREVSSKVQMCRLMRGHNERFLSIFDV